MDKGWTGIERGFIRRDYSGPSRGYPGWDSTLEQSPSRAPEQNS
ncbi:hypothetical protein [Paenibacillus sp. FJAT-26967]|nr:hypothetical protein [Paenibacillus sp. FJAT-26967]